MIRSGVAGSGGDLYNISNPYAGWKYDFGPSNFDIGKSSLPTSSIRFHC